MKIDETADDILNFDV